MKLDDITDNRLRGRSCLLVNGVLYSVAQSHETKLRADSKRYEWHQKQGANRDHEAARLADDEPKPGRTLIGVDMGDLGVAHTYAREYVGPFSDLPSYERNRLLNKVAAAESASGVYRDVTQHAPAPDYRAEAPQYPDESVHTVGMPHQGICEYYGARLRSTEEANASLREQCKLLSARVVAQGGEIQLQRERVSKLSRTLSEYSNKPTMEALRKLQSRHVELIEQLRKQVDVERDARLELMSGVRSSLNRAEVAQACQAQVAPSHN